MTEVAERQNADNKKRLDAPEGKRLKAHVKAALRFIWTAEEVESVLINKLKNPPSACADGSRLITV